MSLEFIIAALAGPPMAERFMVTLLMLLKLSVTETDRLVVLIPSDSMVVGVASGLVTIGTSLSTVNDHLCSRILLLLSVAFTETLIVPSPYGMEVMFWIL